MTYDILLRHRGGRERTTSRRSVGCHVRPLSTRTAIAFALERTHPRTAGCHERPMIFSPRPGKSNQGVSGDASDVELRSTQPDGNLIDDTAADHRLHRHGDAQRARRVRRPGHQLRHFRNPEGVEHQPTRIRRRGIDGVVGHGGGFVPARRSRGPVRAPSLDPHLPGRHDPGKLHVFARLRFAEPWHLALYHGAWHRRHARGDQRCLGGVLQRSPAQPVGGADDHRLSARQCVLRAPCFALAQNP